MSKARLVLIALICTLWACSDKGKSSTGSGTQIDAQRYYAEINNAVGVLKTNATASRDLDTRICLIQEGVTIQDGRYGELQGCTVRLANRLFRDQPQYVPWVLAHEVGHSVHGRSEKLASQYALEVLKDTGAAIP